jgi:hypothetical protein
LTDDPSKLELAGSGRSGVLIAKIADIPGPHKTLRENEKSSGDDGQPNGWGSVTEMIARAKKQNQGDIAKPT